MYTIAERGLNTAIKCVRSAIKYVRSARWKLIDLLSRCALHSTHGEDTFEHLFFFFLSQDGMTVAMLLLSCN